MLSWARGEAAYLVLVKTTHVLSSTCPVLEPCSVGLHTDLVREACCRDAGFHHLLHERLHSQGVSHLSMQGHHRSKDLAVGHSLATQVAVDERKDRKCSVQRKSIAMLCSWL